MLDFPQVGAIVTHELRRKWADSDPYVKFNIGVVMLASLLCLPTVPFFHFSVFSFFFERNVVGGSVAKT
jgi:hypothetical protein